MTVRIGVLGAARIVESALLRPAAEVDGVVVTAIAARSAERAARYAAQHGIPRALADYDAVVDDPDVDAIYIPTPAAMHGRWIRRAIDAGKHVLCEKPFTANADEAEMIAELALGSDLVVMEAFHSVHHPMWSRVTDLVSSGSLGEVLDATATFVVPHADRTDIRWDAALGGGALMDLGCYPVRLLLDLLGVPDVVRADADEVGGVDASMTADLLFGRGAAGRVRASMHPEERGAAELLMTGTAGRLTVRMPYHPHFHGLLTLVTPAGTVTEQGDARTTYSFQLAAFRDAVVHGGGLLTGPLQATATMRTIDAIYRAAGMSPREPAHLA
ncbi:Gfo/Idh/MocA family protein [Modestobacter roseus]|uniref:Putative dehydrogenase n=1 Tax=Modestobacter roseus TaxID=1181884 RepID=A0A562IMJ3_9ACTN|nr:Gfo/Idh/MocA family oxidoreductase [Modestobacter roseus]MQA33761.1 gfo/Idh/MocA family oxidoreductase [Modestobacter roseus]TWH72056.1 putative dehydrogenase [Modestobacter roseus]